MNGSTDDHLGRPCLKREPCAIVPSRMAIHRCDVHRTPLEIDAIRGYICELCDAENERTVVQIFEFRRLRRWLRYTVLPYLTAH